MYVADFETTTKLDDCRVWAWGMVEIGSDNVIIDNSIDSFIEKVATFNKERIYFHNLKFDIEFILYYLFSVKRYKISYRKKLLKGEMSALVSDMGAFYSLKVCFENGNEITFWDSLKIIPLKVEEIPKAFGLKENKCEIDYNKEREVGYIPDNNERIYIGNDVLIVAKALEILLSQGLSKMTQAGCALHEFKSFYDKDQFKNYFPLINNDPYIRKAYKGGYVYLNPMYVEKDLKGVNIFDVNSLYPSKMYYKSFPIGRGVYYKGKYKKDVNFPLYVQRIRCIFEVKENKLPTIQIKNNPRFCATEYLNDSSYEVIELTLTSVDLDLFFEHYNVYELEYIDGYMYAEKKDIFKEYIDHWIEIKQQAVIDKNAGLKQIAKIMLNSLYGRFALNRISKSKMPFLDSDGYVRYRILPDEERETFSYIPLAAFVTSYAREETIRTAQKIRDYSIKNYGEDYYIYSDTDSIHTLLSVEDCAKIFDIDSVALGAWDNEGYATKARFIRAKTYIEEIDGKLKITCAGMPSSCYKYVTWENFHSGLEVTGKLVPKRTMGGIVLVDTTFKIKEVD